MKTCLVCEILNKLIVFFLLRAYTEIVEELALLKRNQGVNDDGKRIFT